MTHLEIENLVSDYLEGQLDTVRRVAVEQHLGGCAPCRELVADVRHVFELCRAAEPVEPAPWLVPKILRATLGERKPSFMERLTAWFRLRVQLRVLYGAAMTVFSLSVIANACGINLRHLKLEDLNPRTWAYQADRNGHLLLGRAEKYYYDLKVVYEIESRLRQLRAQPAGEPERPKTPPGSSTEGAPSNEPALAFASNPYDPIRKGWLLLGPAFDGDRTGRSAIR
jgi:Putative zinc-finger